jgi:ketosteroid isomerase-like protein
VSDPHQNDQLITSFYEAFARRDAEAMAACYHADVRFSDPVFPDLRGRQAGDMWRMLCERGEDLEIEFSNVQADDQTGSAHRDATYTFSATGRKVLNRIDASFRFEDGLMIEHRDDFPLYKWTRMALGPAGMLLGWTPMVQGKIRKQARAQLEKYSAKRA